MAIYGLLTDIHGNGEALAASLSELDRRGVERILSMGDLVGYNADSEKVVRTLKERRAACITGNHDLIALGDLGLERCWYQAAHALTRTRETLGSESRAYLAKLPGHLVVDDSILLIHGDLGDPQYYLRTAKDVAASAERVRARFPNVKLVIYGHTHDPRVYRVRSGIASRVPAIGVVDVDAGEDDVVYLNPGSVDGQRKPPGERSAELAVLDTSRWSGELVSVPYDDAQVERKARTGGYRVSAADKLAFQSQRLLSRVRRALDRVVG